jgi:hypothetical protein
LTILINLRILAAMKGRIILQDLFNRSFLSTDGTWVSSCDQPRVFEHTYIALLEALKYPDKRTQILWCFENPTQNIYLLVRPDASSRILQCETCPVAERWLAPPEHAKWQSRAGPAIRSTEKFQLGVYLLAQRAT